MTNFLRSLMFWRKSPEGEASGPTDESSPRPAELEYQAEREEELLQARHEDDEGAP
jgi:hypothetical protein